MTGIAYPPQRAWIVKVDSCSCDTAGCCNTGILTYTLPTDRIKVYPNPAHNQLTVIESEAKQSQISIYNLQGQQVKSVKFKGQNKKYIVNVEDLPAGIYFVKVKTNNGEIICKFVKQ